MEEKRPLSEALELTEDCGPDLTKGQSRGSEDCRTGPSRLKK